MSAKVYRGSWTFSGDSLYKGSSCWGAPLATVKGNYVYKGTGFGAALIATISGDAVYDGSSTFWRAGGG